MQWLVTDRSTDPPRAKDDMHSKWCSPSSISRIATIRNSPPFLLQNVLTAFCVVSGISRNIRTLRLCLGRTLVPVSSTCTIFEPAHKNTIGIKLEVWKRRCKLNPTNDKVIPFPICPTHLPWKLHLPRQAGLDGVRERRKLLYQTGVSQELIQLWLSNANTEHHQSSVRGPTDFSMLYTTG